MQAALGLHIMRFPEALEAALADLKPNLIADYAFNLAGAYNSFYAECQACRCRCSFDEVPAARRVIVDFQGRCEVRPRITRHESQ